MGDLLNVLLLEKHFGIPVERRSFLTGELCAIGSCLGQYTFHGTPAMRLQQRINGVIYPKAAIWGTGFIRYSDCQSPFFKKRMHFYALRGELSRRDVERMTGHTLDIPTGDPGLLTSVLFPGHPKKEWKTGIVPHLCDLGDERVEELRKRFTDSCVIDVREDPERVISQIAACEFILSSSLHGLVIADSYGIPNHHLVFSDRLLGDGYKFDDYYSSYGIPHCFTDLRKERLPPVESLIDRYPVGSEMVHKKQQQLEEAFPDLSRTVP